MSSDGRRSAEAFSRRRFVMASVTATAALRGHEQRTDANGVSLPREPAPLAQARHRAQHRRRRLIYNDDGCGPLMQPGVNHPDAFLNGPHSRLRPLPGSQVDSIFFCSGATHVLNHHTEVAESYADVAERYGIAGEWQTFAANLRSLEKKKTDAVKLTIGFCRKHGMEVVYSHRINDIHNQFLEVERSTWFRQHPEYWINTPENAAKAGGGDSPRHWWSALDFERPQVWEHLWAIQREVCRQYDLDGVDTDYFRSPMFFRPNLDYMPATDAQLDLLTGFQRGLREIHLAAGTQRGRPILTVARVPATVETCRHVGIDITRWIADRLVDVLILGGGYVPFTEPISELVQIARSAGIPVYSTISASGMRGPENRYSSHAAWRGAASNMWRAGVNGIMAFNLFPKERDARFGDLGSPTTLTGKDKLFVIDPKRILEGDLVQGIEQSQALPLPLPADGSALLCALPVGDDLAVAAREGSLASCKLRVQVTPAASVEHLRTSLNGEDLTVAEADHKGGWVELVTRAENFRVGSNHLVFRLEQENDIDHNAEVRHIELKVAYKVEQR